MKAKAHQINGLYQFIKSIHGRRFNELIKPSKSFSTYLAALDEFKIKDAPIPKQQHIGVILVDWVLQQGHDFEKQVKQAIERISQFPEAATITGFIDLLKRCSLGEILNFTKDTTKVDLLSAAKFLSGFGIDSFYQLYGWTESWKNRYQLMKFKPDPNGAVFRIGNKTADYIRVLVGHWDAVAVDSNIDTLLKRASIGARYTYLERRTTVQLAALELGCRPLDLDYSIYEDSITQPERYEKTNNEKVTKKISNGGGISAMSFQRQMPPKGSLFLGEINDLSHKKPDSTGWQPRDIIFYKAEINSQQIYGYPSAGDSIILDDVSEGVYTSNFTEPDTKEHVCLGKPHQLKPWYRKKGYSDWHINRIRRDGYRDKVYFEYIGKDSRFYIYTEKEFKAKYPSVRV